MSTNDVSTQLYKPDIAAPTPPVTLTPQAPAPETPPAPAGEGYNADPEANQKGAPNVASDRRASRLVDSLWDTAGGRGNKRCNQPFFARYLEGQNRCRRGGEPQTKKYPSDSDEHGCGPGDGGAVTLKFPSDQEDHGGERPHPLPSPFPGGGGCNPITHGRGEGDDLVQTLKFPSDSDEQGHGDGGGIAHTLKFPSDQEDHGGGTRWV